MHIVLVSPAWPPASHCASGIVTYVQHLRNELIERGHEVTVFSLGQITLPIQQGEAIAVKPSWRFKLKSWLMGKLGQHSWGHEHWGLVLAEQINALSQHHPVDIVEMEESFGWCEDVAKQCAAPVVIKLHGPTFLVYAHEAESDPAIASKIEVEGRALTAMQTIIAPSQCTLDDTLARYALKPAYAAKVVNPLVAKADLPQWSLSDCNRNQLLFVGRFDMVKGADLVLMAFRKVLETRPELQLVFVGPDRGLVDASGQETKIMPYIDSLFGAALSTRVIYKGQLSPSEIEVLRTQSLATIIASRWESQSYTTLEAMLQSCPVIAAAAGGIVEIIKDESTGKLFEAGNYMSLVSAMEYVLSNQDKLTEMGHRARTFALQEHAPSVVAEATLSAYQAAIASAAKH